MKIILRLALSLLTLVLIFNPVIAQDDDTITDPKSSTEQSFTTSAITTQELGPSGNTIYEVFVEETGSRIGRYTARTGPDHPITQSTTVAQNVLFGGSSGSTGTTFNTIRSYTTQTDYVQGIVASSNFTMVNLDLYHVSTTPIGTTGFRTTWQLPGAPTTPDHLRIVQDINVIGTNFQDSRILVRTEVINLGTAIVSIGVRYYWDFQITTDDGPTFTSINPDASAISNETDFINPSFEFYRIQDNVSQVQSPLFSVNSTVNGPSAFNPTVPDLIQFTSWGPGFGQAFDYTTTPTNYVAGGPGGYGGGDSAVAMIFGRNPQNAILVWAGGSTTFDAYLFAVEPDQNTPPVVVDDYVTVQSGTTNIDVLDNDFDLDGDEIIVTIVQPASNGSVVINLDYTITYTPNNGFAGNDSFIYTISDGNGGEDIGTAFITVEATAPIAVDDSASVATGGIVNIPVLNNDSDPNNDVLSVINTTNPANGTVAIQGDGTINYQSFAPFTGTDTFTYTISDNNGGTDTATVTVTVTANSQTNQPPVAVNDGASTNPNIPVTVNVLSNDFDPDGNPLTVTGVSVPTNGTAVNNNDGTITYTPNNGFVGNDSFTYTISDNNGGTATATVNISMSLRVCVQGDPDYNPAGDLIHEESYLIPGEGYRVGVVVNRSSTCAYDIGMASYYMYDLDIDNQIIFSSTTAIIAPNSSATLQLEVPQCARQIDLFYGAVLQSLNGVRYGERLIDAIQLTNEAFCTP